MLLVIVAVTLAALAGSAAWIWIDMKDLAGIVQETVVPPNWDEQRYLAKNPDVAAAVRRGYFKSGWRHYIIHGVNEGRSGASIEVPPEVPPTE